MSEPIIIALLTCGTCITVTAIITIGLGLFTSGIEKLSSFDRWLLARAKVAEAKALHERVCPRLTDTPRLK